ncbi:DUF1800 domain-containing protein [Massilia sp. B-10]|nr:DUF1800 domain-containing protein [Massilia sp. B-10]
MGQADFGPRHPAPARHAGPVGNRGHLDRLASAAAGTPSPARLTSTCSEANAFGNYRTLLQQISTSAAMGEYLTFRNNAKFNARTGALPDENYARNHAAVL